MKMKYKRVKKKRKDWRCIIRLKRCFYRFLWELYFSKLEERRILFLKKEDFLIFLLNIL